LQLKIKEITLRSESNIAVAGAVSALNTTALRHTKMSVLTLPGQVQWLQYNDWMHVMTFRFIIFTRSVISYGGHCRRVIAIVILMQNRSISFISEFISPHNSHAHTGNIQ